MLARNSDTEGALRSVRELEDRFNHKYQYPWVFLNEEPFSDDFKNRIGNVVSGQAIFEQIPHDHWYQPDWIDEDKAKAGRDKMVQDNIIYGGTLLVCIRPLHLSFIHMQEVYHTAICAVSTPEYVAIRFMLCLTLNPDCSSSTGIQFSSNSGGTGV